MSEARRENYNALNAQVEVEAMRRYAVVLGCCYSAIATAGADQSWQLQDDGAAGPWWWGVLFWAAFFFVLWLLPKLRK